MQENLQILEGSLSDNSVFCFFSVVVIQVLMPKFEVRFAAHALFLGLRLGLLCFVSCRVFPTTV